MTNYLENLMSGGTYMLMKIRLDLTLSLHFSIIVK